MLVLTRRNQESVVVAGPDGNEFLLTVTVIQIQGRRVKLGFEAAEHVRIQRSELRGEPPAADQPLNRPPADEVGMSCRNFRQSERANAAPGNGS